MNNKCQMIPVKGGFKYSRKGKPQSTVLGLTKFLCKITCRSVTPQCPNNSEVPMWFPPAVRIAQKAWICRLCFYEILSWFPAVPDSSALPWVLSPSFLFISFRINYLKKKKSIICLKLQAYNNIYLLINKLSLLSVLLSWSPIPSYQAIRYSSSVQSKTLTEQPPPRPHHVLDRALCTGREINVTSLMGSSREDGHKQLSVNIFI